MLISHKYKCIIVQPRKTAGSSLAHMFFKLDPESKELWFQYNKPMPPYGHQTATQCKELVGDRVWNSYYKFGFVRNVFDWVKSYYAYEMQFHMQKGTWAYETLKIIYGYKDRLTIAKDNIIRKDDFLRLYFLLKWWYPPVGVVGQSSWFNEELDRICIFEDMKYELEFLGKTLGFDPNEMLHINKSNSSKLSLHSDTNELIKLMLNDDIKLYMKLYQRIINRI